MFIARIGPFLTGIGKKIIFIALGSFLFYILCEKSNKSSR